MNQPYHDIVRTIMRIIECNESYYIYNKYNWDYQHNWSNATLNRFFSLHYLLPFLLAALAIAHLIAQYEGPYILD